MQNCALVLFLFLSFSARATVGIGGLVTHAGQIQTDKDGGKNTFRFDPFISVDYRYNLSNTWSLRPEFGVAMPQSEEGDHTRTSLFLFYNVGYFIMPKTEMQMGLGVFYSKVSSESQTVTLNNGSGTQTFYRPEGSVTSYNSTLNIGLQQYIYDRFSTKMDFLVMDLFSSESRTLSYLLALRYDL